jgi:hypothetical protein
MRITLARLQPHAISLGHTPGELKMGTPNKAVLHSLRGKGIMRAALGAQVKKATATARTTTTTTASMKCDADRGEGLDAKRFRRRLKDGYS